MKSPGRYRWRECLVLAGVPTSVALAWLLGQIDIGNNWLFEWGIGGFYAVCVLCPLAWYRSLPWLRTVFAIAISVLAWHWALHIAMAGQGYPVEDHRLILRSIVAGFFGAVLVGAMPLARSGYPNWERRLAAVGVVGGFCGGQMGLLSIWNFEIGFFLGMAGWQFAVTGMLLYSTAPQRDGKLIFWPIPPQLN